MLEVIISGLAIVLLVAIYPKAWAYAQTGEEDDSDLRL